MSTNRSDEKSSRLHLFLIYGRIGEVTGIDAGYGVSHLPGDMVGVRYTGVGSRREGYLTSYIA
ncbi:MAG: hypothetical protein ACOCWS_00105 [Alkalispirochaetaceae bacterium]